MQVRLLLGSAGSGKTFQCLSEARQALSESPEGPPLVLVAPRQGTYQLEQQLLATPSLVGYTRLSIVWFESLARLTLEALGMASPRTLTEEGRLMVLRGLLAKKRAELKIFRASARLTGFAQQLSQVLGELQRAQLGPAALHQLAAQVPEVEGLAYKLQDLAILLQEYLDWLESHNLQDEDSLLSTAAELLHANPPTALRIESLWVDGFAEFSAQELDLICALTPCCERLTVTFCLDPAPLQKRSWLSHWSVVRKTLESCQDRFAAIPNVDLITERLHGNGRNSRFSNNPVLRHLERCWAEPRPYQAASGAANEGLGPAVGQPVIREILRVVACADRDAEVTQAAREILGFVRTGARYRDVSVVVRKLDLYHQAIQRIFLRYQIPFFLDRRESVSHHPLAELTRSALRALAFGWQHEDWFAALKSGLVPAADEEIDLLENEALARGWKGRVWHEPIRFREIPKTELEQERLHQLENRIEKLRRKIVPPFEKFELALAITNNRPTGPQLAAAVRQLWGVLKIQQRFERWAALEPSALESRPNLSVHETVWRQMNAWLDNAELAFPKEPLQLREWLPILEAGLANLTVGFIPPALDQVLVGAVDRSRTPQVKLALVLGLNETVFPATPEAPWLLTEADRVELEKRNVTLGSNSRRQLGRERYLAYIACTRAGQRLVLTYAAQDPMGAPLNPSSFLSHVRQLFPSVQIETAPLVLDWKESQHVSELIGTLLKMRSAECGMRNAESWDSSFGTPHSALRASPGLASLCESLQHLKNPPEAEGLAPELATRLYGPVLRTSVSRMEQFAACPFKFFIHSGLGAEERQRFELDVKEQGTFQHDVLALFHQQLRTERKRWRDITPVEARERVGKIAHGLLASFRDGLLETSEETRFIARVLTESLQDFVETLVGWMHDQYQFDPVEVELPFGEEAGSPGWTLDLGDDHKLELRGRIDRIDLHRDPKSTEALCVVVDYKSSQKQLDPVLLEHGLQLQLLTYLNVLRQWPNPRATFAADQLDPAGVFYVNLRGRYGRERNRLEALADLEHARKLAYRHSGRFDVRALPYLDCRREATEGDQFNYRLTNAGRVYKTCKEAVATAEFNAMLARVEKSLRNMGKQVFAGQAEVDPYRKGAVTACDQCSYFAICRVDPWTHRYRVLRRAEEAPTA